jgi:hypothetical protein
MNKRGTTTGPTQGRKKKHFKIKQEKNLLEYGIMELGTRDVYADINLKFNFKTWDEYKQKEKEIKNNLQLLWEDSVWLSPTQPPIITSNKLTENAIKASRTNQIVIQAMFYTRKPIKCASELPVAFFENIIFTCSK